MALKVKRIYAASIRGKAGKGVIDRIIMPIKSKCMQKDQAYRTTADQKIWEMKQ